MNYLNSLTVIIFCDATITLLFYLFHRTVAHQKPPSIFQLLDQLENVTEKLLAE
jgi:hypothetical protein